MGHGRAGALPRPRAALLQARPVPPFDSLADTDWPSRDADAALLVFDITDVDSFARVKKWVKELRQMAGKDIVLAVAGNKADLERSRQVPKEEAEAYAASIGATLFSTSAKLNKGVEPAFLAIATSAFA